MGDIFSRLAGRIMREPSRLPVHGPVVQVDLAHEAPGPQRADATPGETRRVEPDPPGIVSEHRDDGGPPPVTPSRFDDDAGTGPETHQRVVDTQAHVVTTGDEATRPPAVSPVVPEAPVRRQTEAPMSPTLRIVDAQPRHPDPSFVIGGFSPTSEPRPDPGTNVEIHIGRLEVRANLEPERTTVSRSRADARPEPLALEDYLSGRKASR